MSDYQEFVNETIVFSDEWRTGQIGISNELIRVRDQIIGTQGAVLSESLSFQDEVSGQVVGRIVESMVLGDRLWGLARFAGTASESLRLSDEIRGVQGAVIVESISLTDQLQAGITGRVVEGISFKDEIPYAPIGNTRIVEALKFRDTIRGAVLARVEEVIAFQDELRAQVSMTARINEFITFTDELSARATNVGRIAESIYFQDEVSGKYQATGRTEEFIYLQDELPARAGEGFAWTAPIRGWSMSRYDGYPFTSPVVVDDVAYACTPDGVYALAGGTDSISAILETAKLDVGKGNLAHPLSAYMEYELKGLATMTVTQTQGGQFAEAWTYPLNSHASDELTNGRFIFGRGMRGRHFKFTLRLDASRAYINDLYVVADATKRRI